VNGKLDRRERKGIMDNKLKIIAGALAVAAACLGLIKTFGYLWGGIASLSTIIITVILIKSLTKEDKNTEQLELGQSIGDGAEAKENIEFEEIEQTAHEHADNIKQSVGKGAKSEKGVSFRNIKQK